MSLEPTIWSHVHGAVTHFPIALTIASAFCDAASLLPGSAERKGALRSAAAITLVLGALGSYAAAASGLILARGQLWGHATLLRHHQFAWPAFALVTALAAWRVAIRHRAHTPGPVYLTAAALAVAAMGGAGYWGAELLNQELTPPHPTPSAQCAASPTRGRQLFIQSCAHCHGDDAHGSGEDGDGPDLSRLPLSNARITAILRHGIPEEMPSFSKKYGPDDLAALIAYLRTLH